MGNMDVPQLYKTYFLDKADERRMLFQQSAEYYHPRNGIYPGSFVHITPSFYIENMTYIDSDKRIPRFFKDENLRKYIDAQKKYDEDASVEWYRADYTDTLEIEEKSFDIMFSFYAGFISQECKKYLKDGGIFVCNNSHGDASLAFIDRDYTLIGVIKRSGENFRITEDNLDSYCIKKDGSPIDGEKVRKRMIGESFSKKGYAYIFRYKR